MALPHLRSAAAAFSPFSLSSPSSAALGTAASAAATSASAAARSFLSSAVSGCGSSSAASAAAAAATVVVVGPADGRPAGRARRLRRRLAVDGAERLRLEERLEELLVELLAVGEGLCDLVARQRGVVEGELLAFLEEAEPLVERQHEAVAAAAVAPRAHADGDADPEAARVVAVRRGRPLVARRPERLGEELAPGGGGGRRVQPVLRRERRDGRAAQCPRRRPSSTTPWRRREPADVAHHEAGQIVREEGVEERVRAFEVGQALNFEWDFLTEPRASSMDRARPVWAAGSGFRRGYPSQMPLNGESWRRSTRSARARASSQQTVSAEACATWPTTRPAATTATSPTCARSSRRSRRRPACANSASRGDPTSRTLGDRPIADPCSSRVAVRVGGGRARRRRPRRGRPDARERAVRADVEVAMQAAARSAAARGGRGGRGGRRAGGGGGGGGRGVGGGGGAAGGAHGGGGRGAAARGRRRRFAAATTAAAAAAARAERGEALAAAASAEAEQLAASVGELPPLPLPDEWVWVHALRSARHAVAESARDGRERLAAYRLRIADLEAECDEQLRISEAPPGRPPPAEPTLREAEREHARRSTGTAGMPQPHLLLVSAPGATSYHASALGRCADRKRRPPPSRAPPAARRCRGRRGTGRHSSGRCATRFSASTAPRPHCSHWASTPPPPRRAPLVREITAGPRLALMRACWAALVIATHTPPEGARTHQREARARDATRAPREATRLARRAAGAGDAQSARRSALEAHAPRGRRRHVAWVVAAEWRVERHGCARRRPRGGAAAAPSDRCVGHSRCEEAVGCEEPLSRPQQAAAAAAGRAAGPRRPAAARPAVG